MAEVTYSGYGDPGRAKILQTLRDMGIVEQRLRAFAEKQAYRSQNAQGWEQSASLMYPQFRNTFYYGNYNFPGSQKTQLQVDATAMLANWKFAAICDAMMTPFSSTWAVLASTNPYIQKDRQCRLYFEKVSHILAEMRNAPQATFRRNNQMIWQMLGAFGNGPMFIDQGIDTRGNPSRSLRYSALPLGQVYIETNHQGQVTGFDRWFRLTAYQASTLFDPLPASLASALQKNSQAPFDFLHCVCANDEYDPARKDQEGMLYRSYYISITDKALLTKRGAQSAYGGYRSFPLPFARYLQNPDSPYADGPAQLVLPELKTANAVKTMYLKVGHRRADPPYLMADDGLTDFSMRPGAANKGGVNQDGKPLVLPLEFGSIDDADKMLERSSAIIGEAFLTTIFSALVENPQMTATQVVELINQKGIFLAPMAGSVAPEYLGSMIDREIDIASDLLMLPPMPGLLREAKGEYKVVYTSPLFKAARAGDAAGFLRTVESALEVAGQMQDSSMLDAFDFETAWPAIADIQSVPESWMSSPEKVAAKVQARAQAKAQEQQIQAMPAQAALMKARAVVSKQTGAPVDNGQQQQQAA